MEAYDKLVSKWLPYLMFFHSPYYKSKTLNTDSRGFRVTSDIKEFEDVGEKGVSILVGGSTVFGVGATQDIKTIPSLLNKKTGNLWLNFGGRAFNSTQEFILFSLFRNHFKNIKEVSILSGINNLILFFLSNNFSKDYSAFFFEATFNRAIANINKLSFKRSALKFFLKPFLSEDFNYRKANKKEILNAFFKSKKKEEKKEIFIKDIVLFSLKRDIENWKLFSKALNFKLSYVLQPMANWIERDLSIEEKTLFSELDSSQENHFRIVKEKMDKNLYKWFQEGIETICKDAEVPFCDMNEKLSNEKQNNKWLFVDRAHLTDFGNELVSDILVRDIL